MLTRWYLSIKSKLVWVRRARQIEINWFAFAFTFYWSCFAQLRVTYDFGACFVWKHIFVSWLETTGRIVFDFASPSFYVQNKLLLFFVLRANMCVHIRRLHAWFILVRHNVWLWSNAIQTRNARCFGVHLVSQMLVDIGIQKFTCVHFSNILAHRYMVQSAHIQICIIDYFFDYFFSQRCTCNWRLLKVTFQAYLVLLFLLI